MLDSFSHYITSLHPAWHGIVFVILFGVALYLCWTPLGQVIAWLRLQKLIDRSGVQHLKNIQLPDGVDGTLYIEHLVLRSDTILLLTVKQYRGNIFAADNIEQWTQVVKNHSYKFPNPLYQMETDLQSLRAAYPKTNITGLVVFTGDCSFPKGKPEQVYNMDELRRLAEKQQGSAPSDKLLQCWQEIMAQSEAAVLAQQAVIASEHERRRLVAGGIIFGVAALYLTGVFLTMGMSS